MLHVILLIISLLFSGHHKEPANKKKWVIDSSSRLLIHGTTNVNTFTCLMECYNNTDTLEYVVNDKSCDLVFSRNVMVIPVQYFNCGNEMITKDFWATVKSDEYRNMKIKYLSLTEFRSPSVVNPVLGKVTISLAGVDRTFDVRYNVQTNSNDLVVLKGSQTVCFSDFQLKAPKKMFGLIQVQENLEVEFHLRLRTISS